MDNRLTVRNGEQAFVNEPYLYPYHPHSGARLPFVPRRAARSDDELRRNIEEWRSEYRDSFRANLLTIRDEVEDTHRVEIEAVIRDDAPLNPSLAAAIKTAREAMANAAKHSGSRNISLYSEFANGEAHIHVRDSGSGFSSDEQRNRVHERLAKRVESVGGLVEIDTAPESGTEIKIIVDR